MQEQVITEGAGLLGKYMDKTDVLSFTLFVLLVAALVALYLMFKHMDKKIEKAVTAEKKLCAKEREDDITALETSHRAQISAIERAHAAQLASMNEKLVAATQNLPQVLEMMSGRMKGFTEDLRRLYDKNAANALEAAKSDTETVRVLTDLVAVLRDLPNNMELRLRQVVGK